MRPVVSQPQVITLNRGQSRPSNTLTPTGVTVTSTGVVTQNLTPAVNTNGTAPIIVRTSGTPNNVPVWPSQPIQLQDLFQRPRPPPPTPGSTPGAQGIRLQGAPIVRTILVPRSTASTAPVLGGGPSGSQHVNTPLPNIQLPSEPVPISPQVRNI